MFLSRGCGAGPLSILAGFVGWNKHVTCDENSAVVLVTGLAKDEKDLL